jgi:hypothetical protein
MQFQHFHQYYEILILLEGNANHIIKGEYYPINKYDIVLLHPLLLHKTEYPSEFLHRRLMINFLMPHEDPSMDFLIQPLLSLFHAELPIYRFSEKVRTELFGILNDIFILRLEHPPSADLLIHIRFIEFLCILYKYRQQNLYIRKPAVNYITQKIYSLTDYIHTNYSQRLSLKSLAERVYISPYYLSHLFKQITGFTLISYIQMTSIR